MTRADLDQIAARLQSECDALDDAIAHAADPELMMALNAQTEASIARLIHLSSEALHAFDALVDSLTESKVA